MNNFENEKTMNILLSCDDRIAKYIPALQASLYENHKSIDVCIYIMHSKIDDEAILTIKNFAKVYNNRVIEIKINEEDFKIFQKVDPKRLGKFPCEAYYHLLSHKYLPKDIERVMYLDIDTICDGNIYDWYNTDFEDHFFVSSDRYKKYDYNAFNSGIFLINTSKLSAENIDSAFYFQKIEQLVPLNYDTLGDQEFLGFAFKQYKNNGFKANPNPGINFRLAWNKAIALGLKEPPDILIPHFIMKVKAWEFFFDAEMIGCLCPWRYLEFPFNYSVITPFFYQFYNLFWKYAALAPFYEEIYHDALIRTNKIKKNISSLNNAKKRELMLKATQSVLNEDKRNLVSLNGAYNDYNFIRTQESEYLEYKTQLYIKEQWIIFPLTRTLIMGEKYTIKIKCEYKTKSKIYLFLSDADFRTQHFPIINKNEYQGEITVNADNYTFLCISSNSFREKGDYIRFYDFELIESKKLKENLFHSYKKAKNPILFLHIGSPKTGTSALQVCMVRNQKLLMKNKICYSNLPEKCNRHLDLGASIIDEYLKKNGIHNYNWWKNDAKDIINEMKNTFFENNCDKLIISAEEFFGVMFEWTNFPPSVNNEQFDLVLGRKSYVMKYFKETFKEFDIKIVCYLRRQDDYIESLYNQVCKTVTKGIYDNIFDNPLCVKFGNRKYTIYENEAFNIQFAKFINGLIDVGYYTYLSQWVDAFGKENIIVRPYEKSQLPHGIEYDFFTNVLGVDGELIKNLELYKEVNTSIKKDITEYKMATKLFNMNTEFNLLNTLPALAYLDENNKKNRLTAKQAEELLEYYKEDNEKIAREYLEREDGILFYDKNREAKDDYPGLSMQAVLDISKELAFTLKQKTQDLQKQIKDQEKSNINESHLKNRFTEVYVKNMWGNQESRSGPGSRKESPKVKSSIEALQYVVDKYQIKSMSDIPCGDFNWIPDFLEKNKNIQYIGYDIVDKIIDKNTRVYKDYIFKQLDITKTIPQKTDLLFSKELLLHLTNKDICRTLSNMKKSYSKYLLLFNEFNVTENKELPKDTGGSYRYVNICLSPFNFPTPLWHNDFCALWLMEDIPDLEIFNDNKKNDESII